MIFLTVNFTELLFQHILINIENVTSQTILIKIVQSLKSINQLRFKKLNSGLIISSFIKILRYNILVVMIMIIS